MQEKQPLTEGGVDALITKRLLMFRKLIVKDYGLERVWTEPPELTVPYRCKADDDGERGLIRRLANIADGTESPPSNGFAETAREIDERNQKIESLLM